jgi:predicted TIM-barrel fold metal-dependent hydrolase
LIPTDADSIFAAMELAHKVIIFSPRYGDSVGIQGEDSTVFKAVRKYPDKFVGFAYFDPREEEALEKLKTVIEDHGLQGVKYGPIYNGVPLDDPRMDPLYRYCVQKDLPLTLHMGTTFAHNSPLELGRAIHVDPIAQKYPDLKIILAHMGHPWYEECVAVIRKNPNVYAEVSALFYRPWQYYNILITAQEYLVTDKIFFGTDYPFTTLEESIRGLKNVNQLVEGSKLPRVTDDTINSILYSSPFEHWWHQNPIGL